MGCLTLPRIGRRDGSDHLDSVSHVTEVEEETAMTEPEVFVLADEALVGVVSQIRDDQWSMEMPADFAMVR